MRNSLFIVASYSNKSLINIKTSNNITLLRGVGTL